MSPMKLYLAGPMTGIPDHNFPAFAAARTRLRAVGYTVLCPAESVPEMGHPWEFYMRRDIALLLHCEGVATLPGVHNSRGARLEIYIAEALGMSVRTEAEWAAEPVEASWRAAS